MVFFGTFLAVVSMVFNIVVNLPLPLPVPGSYRLTLAHVEKVVCGPPPLSPYLQFLCGTPNSDVAQLPAAIAPSAVLNTALFDATVFDPPLTGCLVNCTLVDEPAPVYFGPHLPPPGPVIIAPKFELLAPPTPRTPPVCKPEERPFSYYDLLTLENLVYLGIALLAVYALWRKFSSLLALKRGLVTVPVSVQQPQQPQQPPPPQVVVHVAQRFPSFEFDFDFEDYGICVPAVSTNGDASFQVDLLEIDIFVDEPIQEDVVDIEEDSEPEVEDVEDEIPEVALAVESPTVSEVTEVPEVASAVGDDAAVIEEEPQLFLPVSVVDDLDAEVVDSELSVVEDVTLPSSVLDLEPVAEEASVALEVNDSNTDSVKELSLPSSSPEDEVIADAEPVSTTAEDEGDTLQVRAPASSTQDLDVVAASSSTTPPGAAEDVEQPVKPKRPARSGRKCKALARKREREAAAAAAAANPEVPQPEPEQPAPAPVVEEPLTRGQRRARRGRAHAVTWEAGPSTATLEPEGPVFTEDDFPPLPVEPVAPRALEHRMSYALITAVSRPSASAVVHYHLPPSYAHPAEVDTQPGPRLPRLRWIAASRRYEATPRDSVWTNWTMDLEDIATFRRARNTRRKKKD